MLMKTSFSFLVAVVGFAAWAIPAAPFVVVTQGEEENLAVLYDATDLTTVCMRPLSLAFIKWRWRFVRAFPRVAFREVAGSFPARKNLAKTMRKPTNRLDAELVRKNWFNVI